MELEKNIIFKMNDLICEFRTLNESDVSQDYVSGLQVQKEYIENVPSHVSISSQKKYINDILYSKRNTICGLFINNELVGTAGVQPSIKFLQYIEVSAEFVAAIGIFVFSKSYRGKGLGKTLVWAATYLFHNSTQAEWFGAGMAIENVPSLKSFLSCGFRKIHEDKEYCRVLLNYTELIKPEFIKDEAIHAVD